jgi:ABC-type transport system substrate-binding protein
LRIGDSTAVDVLGYPQEITHIPVGFIMSCAVENLLRNTDKGVEPWLATSWDIGPDFKYIDLHLRQGVKFHDGTDFNAEACKWNLDDYMTKGRTELTAVTSVDVIDKYTVRLNLNKPDNMILSYLAMWPGFMISPTFYATHTKEDVQKTPVGTGPFKFKSWERDVSIEFERFDDYWQKGKPYLDGIKWVHITDPTVGLTAFKAGELDVILDIQAKDAKDMVTAGKYTVVSPRFSTVWGMTFPAGVSDSMYTDVRLRKAVNYAIDRKALAEAFGFGYIEPAYQPVPPGGWGFNPDIAGYPYDPDKAKALLAEAGISTLKTKILSPPIPPTLDVYTMAQAQMAPAGINAEVVPVEWGSVNQMVNKGGWDKDSLFWFITDCSLPDSLKMFDYLVSSSAIWTQILHPADVDAAYAAARAAPDFETKKEKVFELGRLIVDEYATYVPLVANRVLLAKQPFVKDDGIHSVQQYRQTFEDAWLDK